MANTFTPPTIDPLPSKYNHEGALRFLFTESPLNPAARELCQQIGISTSPPLEAGVLLYLFRLEAIGRLKDWPLLFGQGNIFILHLLDKMSKNKFPEDSENERAIWELRRNETLEWLRHQQGDVGQL